MSLHIIIPWLICVALVLYIFIGTLSRRAERSRNSEALKRAARYARNVLTQNWPPKGPSDEKTEGPLDQLMPEVADQAAMIALVAFCDIMRTPKWRFKAKKPVAHLIAMAIEMRLHFIESIKPPPDAEHAKAVYEIIELENIRVGDYELALQSWLAARESDFIDMSWHGHRKPSFKGEFNDLPD